MTRSLVEREVISDHLVKEITIEYLMARGEQPYRILRGGYSLWETHVPAMRLALVAAIQSVEGGVQVAAKQESCPESAPRTETAYKADRLRFAVGYLAKHAKGVSLSDWDKISNDILDAAELLDAQLTKTPSADHDDSNLRGLAEQGRIADGGQCTEQASQCLSLADFDHLCTDRECPIFGQRSCSSNCRCHKTREQMMLDEINRLRKNGVRE